MRKRKCVSMYDVLMYEDMYYLGELFRPPKTDGCTCETAESGAVEGDWGGGGAVPCWKGSCLKP